MDALDNLLAADCPTRTRHFDVVNITRQLLGNYFSDLYADYVKAYREGDYETDVDASIEAGQPFDEKAYHERICKYEGQWWRERLGHFSAEPQGDAIPLAKAMADKYRTELEERYR